jgi:hypothetical protein
MDENSLQNILPAPCAEEDKDTFLNSEEGEEENNELNNLDQYNQINCKQYQNYINTKYNYLPNQILFQQNRTFFQPPFHNQQNSFPPVINSHFINNSFSNNNYIAQYTNTQFFSSYDILGFCHEPQHTVATIDANPKEQNYYEDINSLNDN